VALKKIGIAADHGGKELKRSVHDFLHLIECEIVDYGVSFDTDRSVDYPDYASLIASDLSNGKLDLGIAICGTGIGMCIVGNKFRGVRAALVWDEYTARMSRIHNDANLLCLGDRVINHRRAVDYVKIWLQESFEGARHAERLKKIYEIEKNNFKPRI